MRPGWCVLAGFALLIGGCGSAPVAAPTQTASEQNVAVTLAEWSIKTAPATVKAGSVTFKTTNSGTTTHELVVIPTDLDPTKLPRIAANQPPVEGHVVGDVDEDKLTSAGETGNLDAKATKDLPLALKAGRYILMCNLPSHFGQGMYTVFTVQ